MDQNSMNYKNWMGQLGFEKRNTPIIYLGIPGSHNTFSYSLTPQSDVSPDSPPFVQSLSRWAKIIVNPFIYKWSKTQVLSVKEQLDLGIRYLDIRVVSRNNQIFVAHGLYGGPLFPYLSEINAFLAENPLEIVILDFQHFYNFVHEQHSLLITTLQEIFGSKLCSRNRPIISVTLDSMSQNGQQGLIIYRSSEAEHVENLWPSGAVPTPWPNKLQIGDLIQFLNRQLEFRRSDTGLVTQSLLTVDTKFVIRHPLTNLMGMALKTNAKMMPWIKAQHTGQHGINIVICDFIDAHFVRSVVQLNIKNDE